MSFESPYYPQKTEKTKKDLITIIVIISIYQKNKNDIRKERKGKQPPLNKKKKKNTCLCMYPYSKANTYTYKHNWRLVETHVRKRLIWYLWLCLYVCVCVCESWKRTRVLFLVATFGMIVCLTWFFCFQWRKITKNWISLKTKGKRHPKLWTTKNP